MEHSHTVLIPSHAVEKRTRALNIGVWGFVGVISMFSVCLVVFASHLMFVYILNITSTFLSDHILVDVILLMAFALLFGVGLFICLSSLQKAYIIQPDKIIIGKITNKANRNDVKSLSVQADLLAYMADNVTNGSKVSAANGIKNLFGILNLIFSNMEEGFAQQFFFTELYKRKEYNNPELIKETKHFYIYRCGSKKLRIRKIYTGMDRNVQDAKETSMLKRVVTRALLVFLLFSALSLGDLAAGFSKNSDYISNITENFTKIEGSLADFEYTSKQINNKCYRFEKPVSSQRTSYITYSFGLDGSVEKIEFDIYFDQSSDQMEEEVEYLFTSLYDDITKQQIEKFIQDIQSTLRGDYVYNKLQAGSDTIILGTSGGYVQIHN